MNQLDLKDNIAVITGASQGFGYSIAKRLQKSGAKIINIDKDSTATAEAISKKEISYLDIYEIDITSFDKVKQTLDSIIDKYKKIDIFVNNAGIAGLPLKLGNIQTKIGRMSLILI